MGNIHTCTLISKKDIAVPQIVHVLPNSKNQKPIYAHSLGVKHDGQSLTPTRARSNPTEPHTAGGGDMDELKTNYTYRPLTSKYDLNELGIGEYYLEKQLSEIQNKKSPKKRRAQIKTSIKWDRAVVEMRVKFPQNSQDGLFYTQIDVCLKEYASSKPKSFAKMLKEGPPMRYRWSVWKNFLEPDQFYISELYEKYLGLSSPYESDIKKDTHRTFPNEPYFSEKFNSIGQDQLFNVLKAISLYLPNIGYAQGMNFLAAFLLLVNGGNELEAFWSFVSLARDHRFLMMGFFEKGFPLLNFYIFIFYEMLEAELPGLHEHIKQQQVPDELWLMKWFFTIFLYSLPPKLVIRIWDFVMVEGLLGIIKVSLGFLKVVEKDVLQLDAIGMDLLFEYLKNEGNRITNISHTSNTPPPQNQSNANNNNDNQSNVQLHNQSNNNVVESPIQVMNITDGTYANINPIQVENITTINVNQSNISNHSMPQIPSQNINHTNLTQRDNLGSAPISVHNETTEIQYSIKELDIDEVLDHAEKIVLTVDRLLYFVDLYPEKTHRVLPNPYNHFFKNIHIFQKDISKLAEFQTEIDFHLMKSELSDRPNDEIVISNLLNETGNTNILKDLVL